MANKILLQKIIEDSVKYEDLPLNWNSFDVVGFSKTKQLWDYQQSAVINAIKVLWKYYDDFADYNSNETKEVNKKRKEKFYSWYKDNGLEEDIDINIDKRKRQIYSLLTEFYPYSNGLISYQEFANRMCFWMATGSGKTLVIVKMIQVLKELVKNNEIPANDILVLTHRDDLIQQLKKHIDEYNYSNNEVHIILKELKEYDAVKREQHSLFRDKEITVFYYRSDNMSDEQKEKIIDFKNYDNDGKWYIFLDEAHKGDREDSKRQHIYSILSRNGFLFNFSATFIDVRDIITCAYEFNLSSYIEKGYGKHISILKQEIRAFRDTEDYNEKEKEKIVLKSMILLAYVNEFYKGILKIEKGLYHKPLLLTLVNSVNTEDADLKLFFREIEKIGKGKIKNTVFQESKDELWDELKEKPKLMFEDKILKIEEDIFEKVKIKDVLNNVFNSDETGEIEILVRSSNKQELAFKLKTSDKPFALIKIGDISGWLKDELSGYEINKRFEDDSYFENLNKDESEINILMGSRSFYEGWDSNRPNIINYVNIGIGEEAKKFTLQSVGRGVRIEPQKNKRRRLGSLHNKKEIDNELFNKIKEKVFPLETLIIFGTNRKALVEIIEQLEKQKKADAESQISLFENEDAKKQKLLIPIYKLANHSLISERRQSYFELEKENLELLKKYFEYISDDRVLLMKYDTTPEKVSILRESLKKPEEFYKEGEKDYSNIDLLVSKIFRYFGIVPEEFKELKRLEDEIKHFKNIKVDLRDVNYLQEKIESVKNYTNEIQELRKNYGKISEEEYNKRVSRIKKEEEYESGNRKIKIKIITNHYYLPIIMSDDEKVDYISHIIKTRSEVKFLENLIQYLNQETNKFKRYDFWYFSKLDENLDDIYIPYYNPDMNRIAKFKPDFIFWFKKGNKYDILFVDPKGIKHTDYQHKVDGYREIFMEDDQNNKLFEYQGLKASVNLLLYTDDYNKISKKYKPYWFDYNHIEKIFKRIEL